MTGTGEGTFVWKDGADFYEKGSGTSQKVWRIFIHEGELFAAFWEWSFTEGKMVEVTRGTLTGIAPEPVE